VPDTFTPLPETKKKNSYTYTLVKRTDKAAMYSMINEKYPPTNMVVDSKGKEKWIPVLPIPIEGYEVFLIKHAPAHTLVGKTGPTKGKAYHYPPSERFPGNEDFGKWAWAYIKKSAAQEKFEELNANPC